MSSDTRTTQQSVTGDGSRPHKNRRILGKDRQILANDLVERYASGASIRTLAVDRGLSYGFVHRLLTESGVSLRPRGGARQARTRHTQP